MVLILIAQNKIIIEYLVIDTLVQILMEKQVLMVTQVIFQVGTLVL